MSIAGYAGWPTYDTFLIVSLSGRPAYEPNPLRPNPNPKKNRVGFVSCSRVGSNIDTPTYSWTLTLIPNWTYSVVTIFHFQCTTPNIWVTNQLHESKYMTNHQLKKDVGCKVFQFIHTMKITKLLGYKTLRRANATASWRERWIRANCLRSQYACENPLHQVAFTCLRCDSP